MKPYRSDTIGKIIWYTNHKTVEIAAVILLGALPLAIFLLSKMPV